MRNALKDDSQSIKNMTLSERRPSRRPSMESAVLTPLSVTTRAPSTSSTPSKSSPPPDSEQEWSNIESLIQTKRRNSLSSGARRASVEEIMSETHAQREFIQENCNTPEFRQSVLEHLFRRFASWSASENATYISRNSFRRACREMKFKNTRFVQGDIEVVFVDALLSEQHGDRGCASEQQQQQQQQQQHQQQQKRRLIRKRRPLLNFRQFVMALQLVAIKLYGDSQYQHLDPRYVLVRGSSRVEPFYYLYHKRLLPAAIQFGLLENDGLKKKHGGIAQSPRNIAAAAVGARRNSISVQDRIDSTNTGAGAGTTSGTAASGTAPLRVLTAEQQEIDLALLALQIDRVAVQSLFKTYSLSDLSHGMTFNEFSFFSRECELVPRFCSLSDLLVIFRENRQLHGGDFSLSMNGSANLHTSLPAHMNLKKFQRCLATIAVRFVRRDSRVLRTNQDDTHHLTSESMREKVLLLLKKIANSRGVKLMALKPRSGYSHIRFVSRMNGFR